MRKVALLGTVWWIGVAAAPVGDPAASRVASVSGTVFDSVMKRPLGGATVQFMGAADSVLGMGFSALADSAGRYTIPSVPPGRYVAGFLHPVLDSMGLESGTRLVEVRGAASRIDLALASGWTIATQLCPPGTFGDSLGVLLGYVRDARTGQPVAGASVTALWTETIIERNNVRQRDPEVAATTDSSGWFGMCALPSEVALTLRAGLGADSSGYVELELPNGGLRGMTFLVGGAERVPVAAADTAAGANPADASVAWTWHGTAHLHGTVRDERGQPVGDVRAVLWGTGRQVTGNDAGTFVLDSAPGGTFMLEARAIGFTPARVRVHLRPDEATRVDVKLGERVTAMPTITVRGALVYSRNLMAFEERRRQNLMGSFITAADIERRPATRVSDLLMQEHGVTVTGASRQVLMRRGGQNCAPTWFVDGRRSFMTGDEIDRFFYTDEIAGIEVYPRTSLVPADYQALLTGCGVIALWTRPLPSKIKR